MITQLEELVLGKLSNYSDDIAPTQMWAYYLIIENMKSLKELEMRQPIIQKLHLCM